MLYKNRYFNVVNMVLAARSHVDNGTHEFKDRRSEKNWRKLVKELEAEARQACEWAVLPEQDNVTFSPMLSDAQVCLDLAWSEIIFVNRFTRG